MKWSGFALVVGVGLGCGGSSTPPPRPVETPVVTGDGSTRRGEPPAPPAHVHDDPAPTAANRCAGRAADELSVDGMLDDWRGVPVFARAGAEPDGAVAVRCAWDGHTLVLAIDVKDDRVIRVQSGTEDHVVVTVSAGGKPLSVTAYPGNAMGKPRFVKPAQVAAADSLQPRGFAIELAIPATSIPESTATAAFALDVVFHDSDAATGRATTPVRISQSIELADRSDLFQEFLASVKLRKADITVDVRAELDPDRKGKERLVAGGTAIGVITEQFAFVTLPAASAADVKKVELLPLGPRNQMVVAAIVKQGGNGGSRELLMLWTVWSGQLQPLAQIEIKKEQGGNVLESTWKIVKGKKAPELWLEPKPAVGWTAETWNEEPAPDLDPILLPWDPAKRGTVYTLTGAELARRDLPVPKKRN